MSGESSLPHSRRRRPGGQAREMVRSHVPAPLLDRAQRLRHLAGAAIAGGELAVVRAELTEALQLRTRELLERTDTMLSSYDRRVAAVVNRLLDLEERVTGLRGQNAMTGLRGPSATTPASGDLALASHVETSVLTVNPALAAEFRLARLGPADAERARLGAYVGHLQGGAPVLVVGSGRGDLLAVLAAAGVAATGVEANPVLVARARAEGHDVVLGDPIADLAGRPEASEGAVTLMGVVEHLTAVDAGRLLRAAGRVVEAGGTVLLETADPSSPAGLSTLWDDPLCARLYSPVALELLCLDAGLEVKGTEPAPGPGGRYTLVARRP